MREDRFLLRAGAWAGLAYLLLFGAGWLLLARFMPPIAPSDTPTKVAARYADHHTALMLASVCMMVATVTLLPFSALVLRLVHAIERDVGMLTLMMGFALGTFIVLNFYTGLAFSSAAFRAERSPELVQYANDWGFLQFMGGIPMFVPIWIILAYAILVTDDRTDPVFPRWVGYVNAWVAILYLPELLIYFFTHGIFAWNGLVGFWIPAVLLIGYLAVTPFILTPVARRQFETR